MPQNHTNISVVVPSYNHAPFVERCLSSIFGQTTKPKELLVIDDGSNDGSAALIAKILEKCPFPSDLIVNSNKGLCSSLNEGLEKTSGKYFAYLGSDDVWFPELLQARINVLENRPNAVLGYGHAYLIDENDNVIESTEDWKNFSFPDGDARPMLYLGTAPVSSTVVYRRSVIQTIGWNSEAKLEDYELYLQLAERGEFAFDPRVLAAWRVHSSNTSRDLDFMMRECLASQKRVGGKLGWSTKTLNSIQRNTRFFFGEEFERKGSKGTAASLILKNLGGAPSPVILGRALARLVIPHSLTANRRSANRAKSRRKYGAIKV
jgi:alpha-1,3-rhamnosyltransferase